MPSASTRIGRLSLVCVPTMDQDGAVDFYERIGLEKRTDTPFGNGQRWIEVYPPEGSTGIALVPPPDGIVTPVMTGITLTTDDIDTTHARFSDLGVDVDQHVARMGDPVPPLFWFRDPSGHTLMVVEQR